MPVGAWRGGQAQPNAEADALDGPGRSTPEAGEAGPDMPGLAGSEDESEDEGLEEADGQVETEGEEGADLSKVD